MNAMLLALALVVAEGEAPPGVTAESLRAAYVEEERALLGSQEESGRVVKNLRALEVRRRELDARLAAAQAKRAEADLQLQSALERYLLLETALAEHRRGAGRRLAAVARQTTARPLELLLTAKDPEDFVYRYLALRELAKAEAALIGRLRAAVGDVEAVRVVLDAQQRAAAQAEAELQSEAVRGEVLVEMQRQQLRSLNDEADERRLWMEAIRTQARDLGVMISRLPMSGGSSAKPGEFAPVDGVLVARFGQADPDAGNFLAGNGVRYAAPAGTPVRVVAAGRVAFADWFQGFGHLVIVDHGGGVSTLYAHLGALQVNLDDNLVAGDPLGAAGSTGSIAEPGLYFEVRRAGKPIDPARWLARRSARGRN